MKKKEKLRILHVLPLSLPLESGSTIRSKYIVEMQKTFAIPTVAVYPTFSENQTRLGNSAEINGVKYYYFTDKSLIRKKLYDFRISRPVITRWHMMLFKIFLNQIGSEIKPHIIHAASPYTVGIPSLQLARSLNIPLIYEVRTLSEFDVLAGRHFKKGGLIFYHRKRSENYLLSKADAIISISESSRKEIISRGFNGKKIYTVFNGVDASFFKPLEKDETLLRKYNLNDKFVIGFIGNLKRIEGLDLIIEALPSLLQKNKNFIFFIVGEGPEKSVLQRLANQMHLGKYVLFAGQISFKEIRKYYSIIDLFVVPRIKTKLAEIISPLKPLEAMAMEIPVLGSDVGGITEFIKDGQNGFIFKAGSIQDLSKKIFYIIENRDKIEYIAKNSRDWVIENRNWDELVLTYKKVYTKVLEIN